MTTTDELRRLLDERGVEWMPIAWNPKRETFYHTPDGVGFCADEYTDGVKIYTDATITPAQAIEATLGRGECHKLPADEDKLCTVTHVPSGVSVQFGFWKCSNCGCNCFEGARYCMQCGAKVVS